MYYFINPLILALIVKPFEFLLRVIETQLSQFRSRHSFFHLNVHSK